MDTLIREPCLPPCSSQCGGAATDFNVVPDYWAPQPVKVNETRHPVEEPYWAACTFRHSGHSPDFMTIGKWKKENKLIKTFALWLSQLPSSITSYQSLHLTWTLSLLVEYRSSTMVATGVLHFTTACENDQHRYIKSSTLGKMLSPDLEGTGHILQIYEPWPKDWGVLMLIPNAL